MCSNMSLTEGAMAEIVDFYAQLRGAEDADALPITVRTLETVIRLSTAVAKTRLAKGAHACAAASTLRWQGLRQGCTPGSGLALQGSRRHGSSLTAPRQPPTSAPGPCHALLIGCSPSQLVCCPPGQGPCLLLAAALQSNQACVAGACYHSLTGCIIQVTRAQAWRCAMWQWPRT